MTLFNSHAILVDTATNTSITNGTFNTIALETADLILILNTISFYAINNTIKTISVNAESN